MIQLSENGQQAAMVEINSETDFVVRDDNFKQFADKVVQTALIQASGDSTALLQAPMVDAQDKSVDQVRMELIAKIGENINVRRATYVNGAVLGHYVHGGRIGVIASIEGGDVTLAKDIAMHIAASKPEVVAQEDYPQALVAKEKEIHSASLQDSGKPAEIVEKIIQGKLQKFLDGVSLLGQPFVKNPDVTVGALLKESNAKVLSFVRFEVGEGIEKNQGDFASEVMAQVRGS